MVAVGHQNRIAPFQRTRLVAPTRSIALPGRICVSQDIDEQRQALRNAALHFHEFPKPGKLEIQPLKALGNQRDLALAYSPGVAAPCEEIAETPANVARYT